MSLQDAIGDALAEEWPDVMVTGWLIVGQSIDSEGESRAFVITHPDLRMVEASGLARLVTVSTDQQVHEWAADPDND